MADPVVDILRNQLNLVEGQYTLRFANNPRITRHLPTLDVLIGTLERVREEARKVKDGSARDVDTTAKERLEFYRAERDQIRRAQEEGPDAFRASELGSLANFVFGRYRRHFAGRNRQTRDLGLLGEMIDDLKAIKDEMTALKAKVPAAIEGNLDIVVSNLDMYTTERGEIVNARGQGTNPEQSDMLGGLANGQFEVYRNLFANRNRTTRRPETLQRIIDNLEQILDRMKNQAYISDTARKNISIVNDRLKAYREELTRIKTTQRLTDLDDMVDSLRYEFNRVLDEYSANFGGQDRATRDLDLLNVLCDRLYDLEKLQRKLAGVYTSNEKLQNNLWLTRDALSMLDREYRSIEEAKRN